MGLLDQIQHFSTQAVLVGLFASWLVYLIGLSVYRLYLSPLAKFPGPKLAALTKWYEFYYEVVLRGQFQFRINDMHAEYGPIVRITPFELHVDESTFWDTLYNKHPKSLKYDWMNGRFGNESSIFTTCDPALHRLRRAPLNPMFSRRAIVQQEPVVQERINYISDRLVEFKKNDQVIIIQKMWSAFAGDVITQYSFGFNHNQAGSEDFADTLHAAFLALSEFGHLALQFPWITTVMNMLPDKLTGAMNPELQRLIRLQRDLRKTILRISSEQDQPEKQPSQPTVFHEILQADLPASEKYNRRLADEAQTVIGAGLSTTAWALTCATFYVLANPPVLRKLREELFTAIPDINAPDAFAYSKLEPLQYLRGVYREGIRLSHGVSGRIPRIMTYPIEFQNWVIPAGTPVSMTISDIHFDPELYPRPTEFVPERWMGNPKAPNGESMEKYWVAFGRGPRMCLGINLAYMELTIGLAHFFRRFRWDLYETDESDVLIKHDFMLPCPRTDSKGVRVKVMDVEE